MRTRSRQFRAWTHYLRRPTLQFLPLFLGAGALVFIVGALFKWLYPDQQLTYGRACWAVYTLFFAQPELPFPDHWLLRAFYFGLPVVGLAVVLDGVVRFSYYVLRRDETGKEWISAMTKTLSNHVIVFGLGKVGFRVLQQLLRLGEQVVVLERDPQCPNLAFARKHGVPVLIGNGREEGILEELNIAAAKSAIMVTDDDLANLELALDARKARPGIRVVMRMYDQELAKKVHESFDIHLAFSTAELSAPLFATASSDPSIVNAFYVGEQLLVVADITVRTGSKLIGKTVRQLRKDFSALVIAIGRNGKDRLIPDSDSALEAGHEITLQCEPRHLKEIHGLNGGKPNATRLVVAPVLT